MKGRDGIQKEKKERSNETLTSTDRPVRSISADEMKDLLQLS